LYFVDRAVGTYWKTSASLCANINNQHRFEHPIDGSRPDVLKHLEKTVKLKMTRLGSQIWRGRKEEYYWFQSPR